VPDNVSRAADALARLAAETAKGNLKLPIEFRDECERLDFHIDMVNVDIRVNLWKMTEQMKVRQAFLDRR
jgi:hypothetical protein